MIQHLRFLVSMAAVSSTAMLTTSCISSLSPEPTKPEVALNHGEIHYRLHLFTTDEQIDVTNAFPNTARIAGIYSRDEGERLLKDYQKNKRYHPDASESIVGGRREKVSYSKLTNFRYPTEYDPPVYNKSPDSFPVTPATPAKFETKKLGTQVHLVGRKISDDSLSISIDFDKSSFLGNVNYGKPITTDATDFWGRKVQVVVTENKILVPIFRKFLLKSEITLRNGQFLLIEGSSSTPKQSMEKASGPIEPANFVALIQVEAAP